MTNGEKLIAQILAKSNVKYFQEKTFSDLKNGKFRYDFYCPNINGHKVIIEFNGIQHYQQTKLFQPTKSEFQKQQEHDRRKISYALAQGIKIYCIPFWDYNELTKLSDIICDKHLAKTRWHNDNAWRVYNSDNSK